MTKIAWLLLVVSIVCPSLLMSASVAIAGHVLDPHTAADNKPASANVADDQGAARAKSQTSSSHPSNSRPAQAAQPDPKPDQQDSAQSEPPQSEPAEFTVSGAETVAKWLKTRTFKTKEFTFVRVKYGTTLGKPVHKWATDFPDADKGISAKLAEWTNLKVNPNGAVMELTDKQLLQQPFVYLVEAGDVEFTDAEVACLRNYLTSGGFLMADDFWGEAEWQHLRAVMKRILPDAEPVDLPLTHGIFHSAFDFTQKPQVCSIAVAIKGRPQGITWEREDGKQVHYFGFVDKQGRLMAVLCHNTDLADGWERAKDDAWYGREFSEKRAFPMGVNIIVYALLH